MTEAEFETVLQAVFNQCHSAGYPLNDIQQQILRQIMADRLIETAATHDAEAIAIAGDHPAENPLDDMTVAQREALLGFIRRQDPTSQVWKTRLLNDWLQGQDSGDLQFVRDLYGPQWLNRITSAHLAKYLEADEIALKVGDRIEVSNGLWEWVQEEGPCQREWFPCTVVAVHEVANDTRTTPPSYRHSTTCTIRFESGREFQIQGVYEWNRYNWRWLSAEADV